MKEMLAIFVIAFLLVSCKKETPAPTTNVVPRPMPLQGQPQTSDPMPPSAGSMPGMGQGFVPPPPMPSGNEVLQWDLPKGWSALRAEGMRVATFKPAVEGKVDISVIRLPGEAGGELANVNRWRGQINLPPIDEPGRKKVRESIRAKAGEISLYDFANEGNPQQRMLVGIIFINDHSWFIKMVGDEKPVNASREDFKKLLASLRFPAAN